VYRLLLLVIDAVAPVAAPVAAPAGCFSPGDDDADDDVSPDDVAFSAGRNLFSIGFTYIHWS